MSDHTPVNRKRGRPRRDQPSLNQTSIVEAATALTREAGEVPSIRALAASLSVDPMAIYHYFESKEALFDEVSVSLVRELEAPVSGRSWRDNLLNLARSYLSLLLKYPSLISFFLSRESGRAAVTFMQLFDLCVTELRLGQHQKNVFGGLLVDFIHGFSYGAACNRTDQPITIEMADEPLGLILDAMVPIQGERASQSAANQK
jgi:AcrR family transcriptional regulator